MPLAPLGVPLLFVYRFQSSCAGSAWGVIKSFLADSGGFGSSWDGAAGDELLARFLFRGNGVLTGCDPRQHSCSSGDTIGLTICLLESSTLPTSSASGSLVCGVEGGGQLFEVANLGVSEGLWMLSVTRETFGVSLDLFAADVASFPADAFSFSASRSLIASAVGAPSMN